jgi:hypothetical protein
LAIAKQPGIYILTPDGFAAQWNDDANPPTLTLRRDEGPSACVVYISSGHTRLVRESAPSQPNGYTGRSGGSDPFGSEGGIVANLSMRDIDESLWDFRRRVRDVELRQLYFGIGHSKRRLSSA